MAKIEPDFFFFFFFFKYTNGDVVPLIESLKTKTIVITLANHKNHRHLNEPIKSRSKYLQPLQSAGKRVRPNSDYL